MKAAMDKFKAYAQQHPNLPEAEYPRVIKEHFSKYGQMESLWAWLKRERGGADVSVREAWTELCGEKGANKKKLQVLFEALTQPAGGWQGRLMEQVQSLKQTKELKKKHRPMPYAQLEQ